MSIAFKQQETSFCGFELDCMAGNTTPLTALTNAVISEHKYAPDLPSVI